MKTIDRLCVAVGVGLAAWGLGGLALCLSNPWKDDPVMAWGEGPKDLEIQALHQTTNLQALWRRSVPVTTIGVVVLAWGVTGLARRGTDRP